MSSSILVEKSRYETAGIQALREGDYRTAFVQIGQAAKCARLLADSTDGVIAQAHLADSLGLFERAKRIQQKSEGAKQVRPVMENATSSESEETASSKASQWILAEIPTIRLKDVVGLEEVKRVIEEDVLLPMKHGEAYRQCKIPPGNGVLMYGPPGNGKTFISKAIAGELGATFFNITPATIKSKYVGDTEKNMRALFEEAAKYDPVVIFFDEIHSILGRRGNEKVNAIDEFLVHADGISERKNKLLILGATNYPWLLEGPVFRRLGVPIYVGMPDHEARKKIFELQFDGVPHEDFPFGEFADRSKEFSGADLKTISSAAKKRAIRRMIDNGADSPLVLREDVFSAIKTMTPTVHPGMIEEYRQWRDSRTNRGEKSSDSDE